MAGLILVHMSPVSVPEKTLEHWSSQYIAYRYRSRAALWWPAKGQDIDVRWFPGIPGKAFQLELKTTTIAGIDTQDVLVDLGQLWEYRSRRPSRQPFYVLPRPDWTGTLTGAARRARKAVTDVGFSRSGPGWWFANWMIVLTAADVAAVLAKELAAHGSAKRGNKKRLVRFDLKAGVPARETWGSSGVTPAIVPWRDFWTEMESCGRPAWPSLIRVPAAWTTVARYPRATIVRMLADAGRMLAHDDWFDQELVTLEQTENGEEFVRVDDPPLDDDSSEHSGEHRLAVFLDASAIRPGA
jgi:hypothetical protein